MTRFSNETLEAAGMNPDEFNDRQVEVILGALRHVRSFVYAKALPGVMRAYGEDSVVARDLKTGLAQVRAFGQEHLDWREGGPRRRDAPTLPPDKASVLVELGEEMGMLGSGNAHGKVVDRLLVQGSYAVGVEERTILAKSHMAHQLRGSSGVVPTVLGLANGRSLTAEDRVEELPYARGAKTEFDVVSAAIRSHFGAEAIGEEIVEADLFGMLFDEPGEVRRYVLPNDGGEAVVLRAPKVEGRKEGFANTADTHMFAVQALGVENVLGETVLGTTTQVYAGYQRIDMIRKWGLPYAAQVEMAGFYDAEWTQPAHLGQEYKAVMDQATFLMDDLEVLANREPALRSVIDLGA
ncbi:MAG TPA: hypothetical protein VLG92_02120 [Candidatus Saccharimonadia bacterium]|nr:hypothetical protein [Candidatus Saccharimonadia bacterium]